MTKQSIGFIIIYYYYFLQCRKKRIYHLTIRQLLRYLSLDQTAASTAVSGVRGFYSRSKLFVVYLTLLLFLAVHVEVVSSSILFCD